MASTLDQLAYEVGRLLKVVSALISADGGPGALLRSLGWDLPPGVKDIGLAAVDLTTLVQKVDSVEDALSSSASDVVVAEKFAELFAELQHAIAHLNAAIAGLSAAGDYLDKTQLKTQLSPRMNSVMTAARIGAVSPFALLVLQFFGVVTLRHFDADPSIYQVEHVRTTFDWDLLGRLFTDPIGPLEARYGWGTPDFDGRSFLTNLCALVEALGEPVRLRQLPRRVEEQLAGKSVPEADTNPATQLIASFIRGDEASGLDVGVSLFPLRPTTPGASDAGVAVSPFVFGSSEVSFPLSPQLTLEFDSTVALDFGIALQFRPGHPMTLKVGLLGAGGVVDSATGKAIVRLTYAAPTGDRLTLLEIPGGGVIEVNSIAFGAGVDASKGALAPSFLAKLAGGHVRLNWDGSDGFLASLMPSGGVDATFDLGMQWSGAQGFSFEGSAAADIEIPLHLSIAGLRIDSLHIGIRPSDASLALEASLTCGADIGPVAISLDRVGTLATLVIHDGNLGPVDLGFAFKAPTRLGLSIDAGPVAGGGFLAVGPERGEYAGELQLQFEGIAVRAIGLLTTHLPGGKPGYSLLVIVSAEFPPLELGLGFMLVGVGGLLGINRTVAVEALRAGLKTGALGAVLSPPDPKVSVGQLVATLAGLFPAAGRYVFAPTARIVWGTPTLITIELALVLELPAPVRLVVLGRLRALLPDEHEAIVRIQVDVLGVIDFDRSEAAVDATLVDSRLAQFALTGDMALRMSWGAQPSFLLAVGGFHPRFAAPPGFPALERVAVPLASGDNPKLRLEAYLALTSNTVQFGARVDLAARAGSFSIAGFLSFDALVTLAPLAFIVDIAAKLAIKAGGHTLLSVSLALTLSGPRPWRARGRASFSILFFDISFGFDVTIGDDAPPILPAPVDVTPLLLAAFADARSWSAQLPAGAAALVTLRALEPGTAVLAHPLATLQVRQRVAPLERTLDRFGTSVPSGARRFRITLATIGGVRTTVTPLQDRFAPAQFTALSDDAKLSAPSFEEMTSGAALGADGYATGAAVIISVVYEQLLVTAPGVPEPKSQRGMAIPGDIFVALTATPPTRPPAFAMRDAA